MKTIVIFSALAAIALAAPAFPGEEIEGKISHEKLPEPLKRNKKSPMQDLHSTAFSDSEEPEMITSIHHNEFGTSARHFGLKKKPIIIKKKLGYHLFRNSDEELVDSRENCNEQVRVKLCDVDSMPKSSSMIKSPVNEVMSEENVENSIKMAKEAVEHLQSNLKKMEQGSGAGKSSWQHGKSKKDSEIHQDIEVARQALEHIQKSFGNLESMSLHSTKTKDADEIKDVHLEIAKPEEERMIQWKQAYENIHKNMEIVRNIEDSFKTAADDMEDHEVDSSQLIQPNQVETRTMAMEERNAATEENDMSQSASTKNELTIKQNAPNDMEKDNHATQLSVSAPNEKPSIDISAEVDSHSKTESNTDSEVQKSLNTKDSEKIHLNENNVNSLSGSISLGEKNNAMTTNNEKKTDYPGNIVEEMEKEKISEPMTTDPTKLLTAPIETTSPKTLETKPEDVVSMKSSQSLDSKYIVEKIDSDVIVHHPSETNIENHLMQDSEKMKSSNDESSMHNQLNIPLNMHWEENKQMKTDKVNTMRTSQKHIDFKNTQLMDSGRQILNGAHDTAMIQEDPMITDSAMQSSMQMNMHDTTGEMKHNMFRWRPSNEFSRGAYGAGNSGGIYGIGASSSLGGGYGAGNSGGIYGIGASSSSGGAYGTAPGGASGAVGLFPNAHLGPLGIPLLLSCSPSVVSGSYKSGHTSYSAPAYRNNGELNIHNKRHISSAKDTATVLKHMPTINKMTTLQNMSH